MIDFYKTITTALTDKQENTTAKFVHLICVCVTGWLTSCTRWAKLYRHNPWGRGYQQHVPRNGEIPNYRHKTEESTTEL